MRDRSNTAGLMTQIKRGVKIGVGCVATVPTTKRSSVSLSVLDMATLRTGEGGVRRPYHADSKAVYRSKQQHSITKEPCGVLLPTNQPFGIFQGNASARALCHGHNFPGFTGNDLSRWGHFTRPLQALFGMVLSPFVLSVKERAQVWSLVAVASSHRSPDANVTADPASRVLDFGQRYGHADSGVPLAVLSEDLGTLVEDSAGQGQCPVDGAMPAGGDIEPAVTSSAGSGAADHDPEVKPSGFSGFLNFGAVNQLGLKCSRDVACLCGAPVVDISPPVSTAHKLTHAHGAGATALSLRNGRCAGGVRAKKQGRQKGKRLGFVPGGIKFEFIAEIDRLHVSQLSRKERETQPRPGSADFVSGLQCPYNVRQRGANCLTMLTRASRYAMRAHRMQNSIFYD